jgi:translation initiation factor IF-1
MEAVESQVTTRPSVEEMPVKNTSESKLRLWDCRWLFSLISVLLFQGSVAAGEAVLLPADRVIVGTIEDIRGDQIKVNTGDVEPRYLSSKQAQEKGIWPLETGDQLLIVLNEQNMVLGYHRVGEMGLHQIIHGRLAQPLMVGQEWAVIQPEGKKEQAYRVRPLVRSKMAAVPIGLPAVFLIDETSQIMDVVFSSEETLRAGAQGRSASPPKGINRQLTGTLVKPLANNQVIIRTDDGQERAMEVRGYLQDKLEKISVGETVILLLDNENKVADLAVP